MSDSVLDRAIPDTGDARERLLKDPAVRRSVHLALDEAATQAIEEGLSLAAYGFQDVDQLVDFALQRFPTLDVGQMRTRTLRIFERVAFWLSQKVGASQHARIAGVARAARSAQSARDDGGRLDVSDGVAVPDALRDPESDVAERVDRGRLGPQLTTALARLVSTTCPSIGGWWLRDSAVWRAGLLDREPVAVSNRAPLTEKQRSFACADAAWRFLVVLRELPWQHGLTDRVARLSVLEPCPDVFPYENDEGSVRALVTIPGGARTYAEHRKAGVRALIVRVLELSGASELVDFVTRKSIRASLLHRYKLDQDLALVDAVRVVGEGGRDARP